ncbi:MAG: energy transducer TonB [Cyclobacteriaceae bacterium]|nr:energy transducer TonB [Cyclobacteriaceae bacterium]
MSLIFVGNVLAQENSTEENKEVFVPVEVPAMFPGGRAAFYQFVTENRNYPEEAFQKGIEGRVLVQFVVNEEGKILHDSIKIVQGVHPLLNEEVVRIMKLSPDWEPGQITQGGKKVMQRIILPITFQIDNEKKKSKKGKRN